MQTTTTTIYYNTFSTHVKYTSGKGYSIKMSDVKSCASLYPYEGEFKLGDKITLVNNVRPDMPARVFECVELLKDEKATWRTVAFLFKSIEGTNIPVTLTVHCL